MTSRDSPPRRRFSFVAMAKSDPRLPAYSADQSDQSGESAMQDRNETCFHSIASDSGAIMNKRIIIISGPNGAGKTTFASEFLPHEASCPRFLNADLIAAGLSPFDPDAASIKAARLMLNEIAECIRRGESFAFETTLSGRRYARLIPYWQKCGYEVVIFFLELVCVEIAIARVVNRVAQGGHHIPSAVIRRRYVAGKTNFHQIYKPLANAWRHYDTSGEVPILLGHSETP